MRGLPGNFFFTFRLHDRNVARYSGAMQQESLTDIEAEEPHWETDDYSEAPPEIEREEILAEMREGGQAP